MYTYIPTYIATYTRAFIMRTAIEHKGVNLMRKWSLNGRGTFTFTFIVSVMVSCLFVNVDYGIMLNPGFTHL